MKFADFPFLRYLIFILLGIYWGNSSWAPDVFLSAVVLGFSWLIYLLLVSFLETRKSTIQPSFLAYLTLIAFGALLVQNKIKQSELDTNLIEVESYLAEVTKYDQQKPNSYENLLEVKSVFLNGEWDDSQGKILIYHQSESALRPGDVVLVNKSPDEIAGARNPNEFDYKGYLSRQGVHHRQFLGEDFQVVQSNTKNGFRYFLIHVRHDIGEMLKSKIPHENSAQIALALLLGQKKELDPLVREAYTQAGVMHILAVSGLHVGIIYALFILILKPLKLKKEKAKIYLFFVILVIWLYAFLTGLSPSVVRAATMFSLLTMGQMRERRPSIYNILAFSAILMITYNPEVIFEVGFQLSYLAVLGIVMIQPMILNWWLPRNKILEYIWQLISVSVAAQLVTFPLSVFYFHVFPTYFLLGNLLILPLAFVIMQVGVPLMIFGWIPVLGEVLGWVLSYLILFQNWIAEFIQSIPGGKLDRLTMDISGMILVWGLLLIAVSWRFGSKRKLTWLALGMLLLWCSFLLYVELKPPAKQLIVYQGKSSHLFDLSIFGDVYSWNQGLEGSEISYSVDPNRINEQSSHIPKALAAIEHAPEQLSFLGTDFNYRPNEKKLHFTSTANLIQFWSEGQWVDLAAKDSITVDSLAFRILF